MSETTNSGANVRYDSATETGGDERHAIQTYLSDMLALERHIAQPLERQSGMADTAKFPEAQQIVAKLRGLCEAHEAALKTQLDAVGGHAASPIKSAWSALLGGGAAAVDSVRKTKVSKSLRDDYTALALASIGYSMLETTALGAGDRAVADLAHRHLEDYARCVIQIGQAMPAVVLQELRDDGENVATGAAEEARRRAESAWRSNS